MGKRPRELTFILFTPRNHQASPAEAVPVEVVPAQTPADPSQTGVQNSVNQNTGDGHTSKGRQDGKEPILKLKMAEFKVYVDLYKFFLRMCLSVNVFYLAVLGGLLTFLFRPVENQPSTRLLDTLIPPVKWIFLVTPFIISCVFIVAFGLGAAYWWVSTRAIHRKIKAKEVELVLITTPFFHLLTLLLVAVTSIYTFVAILLGLIMVDSEVLFCGHCFLPWSGWPAIAIFSLIILVLSLIVTRFVTKLSKKT